VSHDRQAVLRLIEDAMADAAVARIERRRDVAVIDLHVTYMGDADGPLSARARATGGGRSICFCEGEVVDAKGTVTAQAMATFRYRDPD